MKLAEEKNGRKEKSASDALLTRLTEGRPVKRDARRGAATEN